MELKWMGRYRRLVAALVCCSNNSSRTMMLTQGEENDIVLTEQEFVVLEMLVEHEDETLIMSDLSDMLGIIPSSFSKITKHLLDYGLVERFRLENNRKNIILKPSEKGRRLYMDFSERKSVKLFSNFFSKLESLSDEQLAVVTDAITTFNNDIAQDKKQLLKEQRLIKL